MKMHLLRTLTIAALTTWAAAGSVLADYSFVTAPDNAGAGWWNAPLGADTRSGGTAATGAGPLGTGALGAGSLRITTDSGIAGDSQAKAQFVNYGYVGTLLSGITSLSFQDYRSSTSTTNAVQRIGLNVEIDFVGNGSSFATLVFEPIYQSGGAGALISDQWQSWDAIQGGNAIWWSTRNLPNPLVPGDYIACNPNNPPAGCTTFYVPISSIIAAYPAAKVSGRLGFNMGSGLVGQFSGAADGLTIRTATGTDVYDFEVAAPAPTTTALVVTPASPVFDANNVVGVPGDSAPGFAIGSFQSNGVAKTDMYFPPSVLFGRDVAVGEVASMSYWTKKGTTHLSPNEVDWFLAIYTKRYAGQVGSSFYGTRIGSEPYFSQGLLDPANTWNEWLTDGPSNWLRFFESTYGYFGGYGDPHWDSFIGGTSLAGSRGPGVPYATQPVLYFSVQTGSAWAAGFVGQVDGFTIELSNGSIATVNFEPLTGTITVRKTVDSGGASPTSFCFTLSPDPGNGQVCANGAGNAVFSNVPVGTYSATETASPATYHQVSNTCTGLSIAAQGDNRSCDVHNAINTGTITVRKTVDSGGASPTSFCFTLSPDPGNGQVCADGSGNAIFSNVPAGTYSATETASLATYHLVSNTCTGLSIAAQGDSRTCDVHNDYNPIAHDVDATLGVGDIALGPSGTKTVDVKASCKNESAPESVRCTVQVSGLPAFCTVQNGAGPVMSGPGTVFLVDDTSSYGVNQTKKFDFKLKTTCTPPIPAGPVYTLTFKACADGGFINPGQPCGDSDLVPDKSPNVVTKSVKLKR
jgi:hypothetical protein